MGFSLWQAVAFPYEDLRMQAHRRLHIQPLKSPPSDSVLCQGKDGMLGFSTSDELSAVLLDGRVAVGVDPVRIHVLRWMPIRDVAGYDSVRIIGVAKTICVAAAGKSAKVRPPKPLPLEDDVLDIFSTLVQLPPRGHWQTGLRQTVWQTVRQIPLRHHVLLWLWMLM